MAVIITKIITEAVDIKIYHFRFKNLLEASSSFGYETRVIPIFPPKVTKFVIKGI